MLAAKGFRVIVPSLRGYGSTRFLSPGAPRNGQQAALAVDVIALMDALKIGSAIVAGCDWGARTANIVAALWPERCTALVSVSGALAELELGRVHSDHDQAERGVVAMPRLHGRRGANPVTQMYIPHVDQHYYLAAQLPKIGSHLVRFGRLTH